MLQIRELAEIQNDPNKVEELLNDDEKELLREYEEFMIKSATERRQYIFVDVMTEALVNLLTLTGYSVTNTANNRYRIGWSWQEAENDEEDIEIYAIVTTDGEIHSSIKAYYSTEELAKKHKDDYTGWYNTSPEIRKVILHRK